MKEIKKIYQSASPLGKVLMLIVLAILVWLVIRQVKKWFRVGETNFNLVNAANTETVQLQNQGVNKSYQNSQYAGWADQLEQAMSGVGTDEDSIEAVFKYMQNKADVLALISAFGVRDYTDDKFLLWNVKPFNLNEWLAAEMDQSDRDKYINKQLAAKQIDYKF